MFKVGAEIHFKLHIYEKLTPKVIVNVIIRYFGPPCIWLPMQTRSFTLTKAGISNFTKKNKHDRKEIIKSHLTSSCLSSRLFGEWIVSQQEIIWFAIWRERYKVILTKKTTNSLINSKLIRVIKYKIKKFSFWFFLFILDNHIPDICLWMTTLPLSHQTLSFIISNNFYSFNLW